MRQKTEPSFSFGRATCGMGKAYIPIEVPGELAACQLRATAITLQGRKMPAKLALWKHGGQHVLIVSNVGAAQRCTITAYGPNGEEVAQSSHLVHPLPAHMESKAGTLRHDPLAPQILDLDERPQSGACSLCIDRFVWDESSNVIVKGSVMLAGSSSSEIEGELDLLFLDGAGKDALERSVVVVRDAIGPHPDYPDAFQRTVSFSGRVRAKANQLVVWARLGPNRAIEDFKAFSSSALGIRKRDWEQLSTSADRDGFYDLWYRTKHAAGSYELALQAACTFPFEPLFSIIVPLFDTPIPFFEDMAGSVLRQSYGNFELVLVNSTPDNKELCAAIERLQARDERIVRVDLDCNLGITENTNAGIRAATGDFLCFLDHDDLLTDDALFCYAKAVNDYPETDLLYSDEDNYENGRYVTPYFKPDWNPDLLLGMNYVCHFLCVRKSIVDTLEPPTSEFDGAQDYHMALRVAERARNVFHARRVLYHWRIHPASTASGIDAKPYAIEAGKRALEAHLERCGVKGTVGHPRELPDRYEIDYPLEGNPLVSIIIPNKDVVAVLKRCLKSIVNTSTYQNFEVVIVENNSELPETFEYYECLPACDSRIRVEHFNGPFNYSRINNFGARCTRGDYLLLLNNDTEVITPDWLERMLKLCMRENTGVVGAKLLYPDATVQHAGIVITNDVPFHVNMHRDNACRGYYESLRLRQNYSAVTGACLMTKREAFDAVGGLDEKFPVDYNDVDYCLSIWAAGYRVVLDPSVELLHYESVSRGFHESRESEIQFARSLGLLKSKWPGYFAGADPMGNPNFEQTGIYAAYHHGKL